MLRILHQVSSRKTFQAKREWDGVMRGFGQAKMKWVQNARVHIASSSNRWSRSSVVTPSTLPPNAYSEGA